MMDEVRFELQGQYVSHPWVTLDESTSSCMLYLISGEMTI